MQWVWGRELGQELLESVIAPLQHVSVEKCVSGVVVKTQKERKIKVRSIKTAHPVRHRT